MLRESMTRLDRTQDSIAASTSVPSSTLALSLPASTIHVEMLVALDKQLGNFASKLFDAHPTLEGSAQVPYHASCCLGFPSTHVLRVPS